MTWNFADSRGRIILPVEDELEANLVRDASFFPLSFFSLYSKIPYLSHSTLRRPSLSFYPQSPSNKAAGWVNSFGVETPGGASLRSTIALRGSGTSLPTQTHIHSIHPYTNLRNHTNSHILSRAHQPDTWTRVHGQGHMDIWYMDRGYMDIGHMDIRTPLGTGLGREAWTPVGVGVVRPCAESSAAPLGVPFTPNQPTTRSQPFCANFASMHQAPCPQATATSHSVGVATPTLDPKSAPFLSIRDEFDIVHVSRVTYWLPPPVSSAAAADVTSQTPAVLQARWLIPKLSGVSLKQHLGWVLKFGNHSESTWECRRRRRTRGKGSRENPVWKKKWRGGRIKKFDLRQEVSLLILRDFVPLYPRSLCACGSIDLLSFDRLVF